MRLPLIWSVAVLGAVCALAQAAAAQQDEAAVQADLTCKAYVVYDIAANEVLDVQNQQRLQPIASLTKLMTAILACERLRFDGRYILTPEEQKTFGVDTMRADKMLELMLVPSNNSVCKLVARIVSGNETAFAREMNAKAAQIGLRHTRFTNASGLPMDGQQSDIFDVLQLARVALTYPRIREVTTEHHVELNGHGYDSTLKELYDRHPELLGGKTGYTKAAGRCLVLRYQSGGREYLVVTLGSKDVKSGFRDAELVLQSHGLYNGPVGAWE